METFPSPSSTSSGVGVPSAHSPCQATPLAVVGCLCLHPAANQCPGLALAISPNLLASLETPAIRSGARDFLLRVSVMHPPAVSLPAAANRLPDNLRSAVLGCSLVSDRLYYQVWTFPPLTFLYFNIAQSLAVFYGRNRADYYLTEGLPLLLTAALPFAAAGLWRSLSGRALRASPASENEPRILTRLAWISIVLTFSLSLISHKEVRFLYPILPFLHVLAAEPLCRFVPPQSPRSRKVILTLLLVVNVLIAGYASQVHQRGVVDVLSYLRHKHEAHNRLSALAAGVGNEGIRPTTNTSVAFFMPCHSTPWRSHLIYPEINAWALTCEPPLNVPLSERSTYLDEADQFYIQPGPSAWLRDNMEHVQTVTASGSRSGSHWARQDPKYKRDGRRAWPQNVVFFEQLEPVMKDVLGGTMYRECWRGFNSHFHDDGRRTGDVLVWCRD
jgi:phosphatidylinositol glycan class B